MTSERLRPGMKKILEFDELIKKDPKAHIARLFPIIGIKNFDDPGKEQHRWKGRVVVG